MTLNNDDQAKLYRENQRKHFAEIGVRKVAAYAPQWSGALQTLAWEWLREQDQLRQVEVEQAAADQVALARRTLLWAKVAGIAACVALLVAVLAWLVPR